ncbi:MmpS family transport accessory protein [Mycobacteroides abscessus]|uniref:MmpS family transport accessory protein n=1 Tax=Mycobacteroides abscessus TaxID=36809 RepID=UPI000C2689A0|nr:MmpS family transport accessory protein [Mycobacteroides abscessus]
MIRVAKRVWLPMLVVAAVAIGSMTVMHLRTNFGATPFVVTPRNSDTAERFNPKVVTYEVFGSAATAVINYRDLNAVPQRVSEVPLPWSLTLSTTLPSVMPTLFAQGDGQDIGCRITVDSDVKDERMVTGVNAETYCLVKAA